MTTPLSCRRPLHLRLMDTSTSTYQFTSSSSLPGPTSFHRSSVAPNQQNMSRISKIVVQTSANLPIVAILCPSYICTRVVISSKIKQFEGQIFEILTWRPWETLCRHPLPWLLGSHYFSRWPLLHNTLTITTKYPKVSKFVVRVSRD